MEISFEDFGELSNGECGEITYELLYLNYTTLNIGYIWTNNSSRAIYVQTNDIIDHNNTYFDFYLRGTLSGVTQDLQI